MKKKDKIKEYDLMLQKYIDNKSFIKVFRNVCNMEENISGFLLGMSKDFLLLQVGDDFLLDGYAIIRKDDFDSIGHSSHEKTQKKIYEAEGLLQKEYGFDKHLPLTNWTEIFNALKDYDLHVIIENIRKDYLDFWIGEIKNVTEKSIRIHNYNPKGQLDEKPKLIKFDSISVVKFGDRYSTTFRKYLKLKKIKE